MSTIKTSAELPCSAKKAFDAWLSEKDHKGMVSDHPECKFDVKNGGEWKVESLEGKFIDIDEKNLKITMTWRYVEGWDDNPDSKLTVQFKPNGEDSCTIELNHEDVPEELREEIADGWENYYFEGMKSYLA